MLANSQINLWNSSIEVIIKYSWLTIIFLVVYKIKCVTISRFVLYARIYFNAQSSYNIIRSLLLNDELIIFHIIFRMLYNSWYYAKIPLLYLPICMFKKRIIPLGHTDTTKNTHHKTMMYRNDCVYDYHGSRNYATAFRIS